MRSHYWTGGIFRVSVFKVKNKAKQKLLRIFYSPSPPRPPPPPAITLDFCVSVCFQTGVTFMRNLMKMVSYWVRSTDQSPFRQKLP